MLLFCSVCLFSLISLLRWLALCVLAAGLHLCWSGCGFGVLPGTPSYLSLTFLHLLICFAARRATKFVSHRSGLVAVYMTKLVSWGGSHMGVCGSRSCHCTLLVVPIYVCGFFSVAAELCILSSCWGWGWLLPSLFWCVCSAFPAASAVFRYVSCSWLPFWGSTPS